MKNQANMKWNEGVDAVPIFIDSVFWIVCIILNDV
jgi:hypothetical protein